MDVMVAENIKGLVKQFKEFPHDPALWGQLSDLLEEGGLRLAYLVYTVSWQNKRMVGVYTRLDLAMAGALQWTVESQAHDPTAIDTVPLDTLLADYDKPRVCVFKWQELEEKTPRRQTKEDRTVRPGQTLIAVATEWNPVPLPRAVDVPMSPREIV